MTASPSSPRRTGYPAVVCLAVGALCFGLGAVSFVLSRNIFDPVIFGRRAAESLSDPGVSAYAADLMTDGIIRTKPDLIAFRPMLLSASGAVVSSKAFGSVVERAAMRVHQAAFSEGARSVLLSLPDLSILVHESLQNVSPALAARIPKSLDTTVARLANGKMAPLVLDLAHIGGRLRWAWPALFVAGLALFIVAFWLAHDRHRTMARAGFALIVVGLVLVGLVAANRVAGLWVHEVDELGLVRGLWRTYLGDLARWGLLFAGIGILIASGASSLLERIDPFEQISRLARMIATPPPTSGRRFVWGLGMFLFGCLTFSYPVFVLSCAGVVIGICFAYIGSRELFRVFLEAFGRSLSDVQPEARRYRGRAAMAVGLLVASLGTAWFVWRNPVAPVRAAPAVLACNGFPELCDRRLDQVVFAGAHNAMSNQAAPGWMFPHHEAAMPQMLEDGIRALLIDVHYGFAGGARIKTDMSTEPNAAVIQKAIGDEAYAAAMRIRDRLVGVDESRRGAYFCHGFCELGAYPVAPALREIRDFVVAHPDEVIILVVEDYVTPGDLAAEFEKAGLADVVYTGPVSPPWPTLRQFIESGRRVLVFIESGRPGVSWLHPAFETFRETPYSFHKVEDFSCRANRGGDAGSLFQINHWIDTTPAPKPSNAAVVNAYPFLLARAEKCAAERRHLPNLIAVDFYRTGDLLAVVNKLNGVGSPDQTESGQ
jgi:hypothetical protein